MSRDFEEIDHRKTELGDLTLSRRRVAMLGDLDVFEVKLGDDFLMSSLFHEVEVALSDLGLAPLGAGPLDVVVGGLGLGYTTAAALAHDSVRSLITVDFLKPVIEWHQAGLVPLGSRISSDPRSRFVHGDFFALAASPEIGFDPESPARRFHAVLLDIDHSHHNLLHPRHGSLYETDGLHRLAAHLHPGGIFALWSDDVPDDAFLARLREAFATAESHIVKFFNPILDSDSASTVYVARRSASPINPGSA